MRTRMTFFRQVLGASALIIALVVVAQSAFAQQVVEPATGSGPEVDQPTKPAQPKVVDAAALRKKVLFLLSGYEYFPKRVDLDKLGPADAVAKLGRDLARDGSLKPSTRLRAVDMLGYYNDADTLRYLGDLIAQETAKLPAAEIRPRRLMRHHAMTALARSQGNKALAALKPMLKHSDLQLRLTAISAIGKHAGSDGKSLLHTHSSTTTHARERRELRKFITLKRTTSSDK